MDRPKQHVIDDRGELQMRAAFSVAGWGVNKIEKDYGIDFDIQVFEDGKATQHWFKVQLKSSEATKYSSTGEHVSETLDREHAEYYARSLDEALIIVHADLISAKTYWHAPQLDPELVKALRDAKVQKSFTVHIPSRNRLPDSLDVLVRTIAQIKLFLSTRAVVDAQLPDFLKSVKEHIDEEQLVKELQAKIDGVKLSQVQAIFLAGQYPEALIKIKEVLENSSSTVQTKFWATLEEERVLWSIAARDRSPQGVLPQIRLETSKRLQLLTKKGPPSLKFYALIVRRAAELEILSKKSAGLYMNFKMHRKQENAFWTLNAAIERAVIDRKIWRKYNQCLRLASYAANYRYRATLPRALLRIVEGLAVFLIGPRDEGRSEMADRYVASALQICDLAVWVAGQIGDQEAIALAVTTAVTLTNTDKGAPVDWARETIKRISPEDLRKDTERLFERHLRRLRKEAVEGDLPATEIQVYENMATGLGIDLSDKDDPVAKLVYVGIHDRDLTPVLRHCKYAFVTPGPCTVFELSVTESLGLPAGPKIIHCELYKYAVLGQPLAAAFSEFKMRHCDACADISPRSPDWKYTEDWQEEENERHREYIERFWSAGGLPRPL